MDKLTSLLVVLLLPGIFLWFYLNTSVSSDYGRNQSLSDDEDGKRNGNEPTGLARIILQPRGYIDSTSAHQRLYDLQHSTRIAMPLDYQLKYSNEGQLRLSGWPLANQTLCIGQLDWIVDQLRLKPSYAFEPGEHARQLSQLIDSFGKTPSGVLEGSLNWLGSYTECTRVSLEHNGVQLSTRYCLARARPHWWPSELSLNTLTGIQIAVCLPETCDTNSFHYSERHRQQIELLARHELPDLYKSGLQFESLFCLPDERSPIRQLPLSAKIYLCLVGGWLAFVLLASVGDEMFRKHESTQRQLGAQVKEKQQFELQLEAPKVSRTQVCSQVCRRICSAVSVRNCLKGFLENRFRVDYRQQQKRPRVHLGPLDFVKVVMALLIVVAHAEHLGVIYSSKLAYQAEVLTSNQYLFIMSMGRLMDTFFLIAGILSAYTMMRKFGPNQLANPLTWLKVNTNVLLRIFPIFALVYWYARSVSPFTSAGPLWDYGVSEPSLRSVCMQEPWWKSIPHLSNLGQIPVQTCAPIGWFLTCYAQIWLLLPPLVYAIIRLPNHLSRFALVSYLAVASALSLAHNMYTQTSIPVEAFTFYGGYLLWLAQHLGYTATLGRLASVSVGALTGYFLHLYKKGTLSKWPSWIESRPSVLAVVCLHILISCLPVVGKFAHQATGAIASLEAVVVGNTAMSLVWPLLNAILIIQVCTVSNHHLIVRFFSHSFWHSFNKLTFIIYLVHWEIEYVSVTASEGGQIRGYLTEMMLLGIYAIAVSIVISLLLHILFEAPLSRLIATVIERFSQAPRPAQTHSQRIEGKISPHVSHL